jgi:1-acyl-sn-glycerol-3-phosphate acyltransferase
MMVLVSVVLMTAYALSIGPVRRWRRPLQETWCRTLCRIGGLRLRVSGIPRNKGPTLFVSNHCSYLDIPVVAREADATFVAKSEVARWPLFGQAARLTGTVFIQRVGADARTQGQQLIERLGRGENLMLFAEGTSTDGERVAPFKSSLFAIAERPPPGLDLRVQPVSITYARALDGTPLTGPRRELYCWYGEATMFPHLWRMLSLEGAEVEVRFLQPVDPEGLSRKQLAQRTHAAVAVSVAGVNAELGDSKREAALASENR